MGAGHTTALYRPGDSPLHRAAPQIKVVTAFLAVLCVVATPRQAFWAFGGYVLLLAGLAATARIPARWLVTRLLIEVPFVVLALLLPFTGGGREIAVLGVGLSVEGMLSGWNILAKGTLGLATSLILAATTSPGELLTGLQRLRTPPLLVTIASLMLRYAEVVVAEAKRMRIARIARGDNPRFLWQAGATARGIGTLFVRSYERGERVHLAMVSRGWTGTMGEPARQRPRVRTWLFGLGPAYGFALLMGIALWTT